MDFLNVGMSMSLVSFLGLFSFSLSVLSYYDYFALFYCNPLQTCLFSNGRQEGVITDGRREREGLGRAEEGDTIVRI